MINTFPERRKAFETKRKGHYREWEAVQLARKKLLEEDEDVDEDEEKNIEKDEEDSEREDVQDLDDAQKDSDQKSKCMSSTKT